MINEQVRDREVRVISSNGEQLGIMSSKEAMKLAREAELDLVKIARMQSRLCARLLIMENIDMSLPVKKKGSKRKTEDN